MSLFSRYYFSRSSDSEGVVVQSGSAGDQPKAGEQNVASPKISIGKPATPTPPQPIPSRKSPPQPEPPKPQPPAKAPLKIDPPKPVEPVKPAARPEPPKSREDQLFEQVLSRKTKASTPDPRVTGLMLNEYSSEEEEEDSQSEDFVQDERRFK